MCGLLRHGGHRNERTVATVKLSSGGLGVENRATFVPQLRTAADNLEGSTRPLHDEQRLVH
jgi:hypothetical protein